MPMINTINRDGSRSTLNKCVREQNSNYLLKKTGQFLLSYTGVRRTLNPQKIPELNSEGKKLVRKGSPCPRSRSNI